MEQGRSVLAVVVWNLRNVGRRRARSRQTDTEHSRVRLVLQEFDLKPRIKQSTQEFCLVLQNSDLKSRIKQSTQESIL